MARTRSWYRSTGFRMGENRQLLDPGAGPTLRGLRAQKDGDRSGSRQQARPRMTRSSSITRPPGEALSNLEGLPLFDKLCRRSINHGLGSWRLSGIPWAEETRTLTRTFWSGKDPV